MGRFSEGSRKGTRSRSRRGSTLCLQLDRREAKKKGWFLIGFTAKDDEDESRGKSSFSSHLLPSPLPLGMPATNCYR